MIYAAQIFILCLAWEFGRRDGISHEANRTLTTKQRKEWHFNGTVLYFAACFPIIYLIDYRLIAAVLLARFSLFDLGYNSTAPQFKITYIGDGAEFWERLSIKVFGKDGAVKKAIAGIVLLIGLNLLNYFLCS